MRRGGRPFAASPLRRARLRTFRSVRMYVQIIGAVWLRHGSNTQRLMVLPRGV